MPAPTDSLTDRLAERRVLKFWKRAAGQADTTGTEALRGLRARARRLRAELDRVIRATDARLARPYLGSNAMEPVFGADWQWRPDPWRLPLAPAGGAGQERNGRVAEGATLYHDCPLAEIGWRQQRNTGTQDLAPFGLMLDVLGFEGSFLSLALDLPAAAAAGLGHDHIFRADFTGQAERPLTLFLRLNIRNGPNTAQLASRTTLGPGCAAEFDLTEARFNERRVEKLWLDIIFEAPAMNAVTLRDLTLSRRRRAEL